MNPRKFFCAAAILAATIAPAGAALNESFESINGSFTGVGDFSLIDASFFTPGIPPPQGLSQLLLTTFSEAADGANASGQNAVSTTAGAAFLNLQPALLPTSGAAGDLSAVKFTFTLAAHEAITFQYQFFTSATAADGQDFAFYTLQFGSGSPTLNPFATVSNATQSSTSAYFDWQTGVGTVTIPAVDFAGTYTLGIGVSDRLDDGIGSGLAVDNISTVPEPGSTACLALGALVLSARRRRR